MQHGLHALVVEGEVTIALEFQRVLEEAGAASVDAWSSPGAALAGGRWAEADLAIVDAGLGAAAAVNFCSVLRHAGIAVVVSTADHTVADRFAGAVLLEKPFQSRDLVAACEAALAISRYGEPK